MLPNLDGFINREGISTAEVRRLQRYMSSPLHNYIPWKADDRSPQRAFHAAAKEHRIRVYRAGNRTGKTVAFCAEAVAWTSGYGWYFGWVPFKPPVYGWVSVLDWEWGVGEVLWPIMRPMIDFREVRSVKWYRKSDPELPSTIIWRNGSQMTFKSAATGRGKYQGAKLHFAGIDEEHPGDIVQEIRARLLDRGGHLWVTCTPILRSRWLQSLEKERGCVTIRASMRDAAKAGLLDQQAVEDYLGNLPDAQAKVRDLGDFAGLEGLVYPEFSRITHVLQPNPKGNQLVGHEGEVIAPWPLPRTWPRVAAIDFGYGNPCSILFAAIEPASLTIFVYRVLYKSGIWASRWADILEEHFEWELDNLYFPMVADWDAAERAELRAKGIDTISANKEIYEGLDCVGRWLHVRADGRPRIYFVEWADGRKPPTIRELGRVDCHKLTWEMEGYRMCEKKKEEDPDKKDVPVKADDHSMDALRYLCMEVEKRWKSRTNSILDLGPREFVERPGDRLMQGFIPGAPS